MASLGDADTTQLLITGGFALLGAVIGAITQPIVSFILARKRQRDDYHNRREEAAEVALRASDALVVEMHERITGKDKPFAFEYFWSRGRTLDIDLPEDIATSFWAYYNDWVALCMAMQRASLPDEYVNQILNRIDTNYSSLTKVFRHVAIERGGLLYVGRSNKDIKKAHEACKHNPLTSRKIIEECPPPEPKAGPAPLAGGGPIVGC